MTDTEKDIDDVYRDRNILACAFAHAVDAPSGWRPDPESPEEWAIVWVAAPLGQVSWHVPHDMAEKIGPLRYDVEYDGHDRWTKNQRLARWCFDGCR